jgi:hypothetical protein
MQLSQHPKARGPYLAALEICKRTNSIDVSYFELFWKHFGHRSCFLRDSTPYLSYFSEQISSLKMTTDLSCIDDAIRLVNLRRMYVIAFGCPNLTIGELKTELEQIKELSGSQSACDEYIMVIANEQLKLCAENTEEMEDVINFLERHLKTSDQFYPLKIFLIDLYLKLGL